LDGNLRNGKRRPTYHDRSSKDSGFTGVIHHWRRRNRGRFNRLLVRIFGVTKPRRAALEPDTRRILVVRLNKRLGNILFLTPMLRSLAVTLPAAQIDVLIQNPAQKPLLETLPGVARILVQEQHFFKTLRTLRELRSVRYDLVIDPTSNSSGTRIGVALARARQRMGFARDDQWLHLTHAAGRPDSPHQAIRSVELLTGAIASPEVVPFDTLAVFPGDSAQRAAEEYWQQVFGTRAPAGPVIGFFSRASDDKMLPQSWWQAWIAEVRKAIPEAELLEILPVAGAAPVAPECPHLAIEKLIELAAFMARLDQFVAADSGPMHLAAAAGTPVIGLFQATSPRLYAPLGRDCICMEGQALTPAQVARCLAGRTCGASREPAARGTPMAPTFLTDLPVCMENNKL
jgi:ADP-heptose:LPS heptosyltransferase